MRKYILLMTIVTAFGTKLHAQCYDVSTVPYYPFSFEDGTPVSLYDDQYSEMIDMGFDFCFFGDTVNRLTIASNGFISFDSTLANMSAPWQINEALPHPALPVFSIMNAFTDLSPSNNSVINYKAIGTAPHRKAIISFLDVPGFSCSSSSPPSFTGQIVMHESSNVIDLFIYAKPLCDNWNDGNSIQGIHNQDGTVGLSTGGRNYPDQWIAFEDAQRFTPICDCPTEPEPEPPLIYPINGKVYHDLNSNCSPSNGELAIPNVRLEVDSNMGFAWTDSNGEFQLHLDTGAYSLTQSALNPSWLQYVCPGHPIPFSIQSDVAPTPLFLGNAPELTTDLRISFANSALRPCNAGKQIIQVCNDGTQPAFNVLVNLSISDPDSLLTAYLETPWQNTPGAYNQFYAVIDTLLPLSCVKLEVKDSITCFTGIKEQVCFDVSVAPLTNETTLANNSESFCERIAHVPSMNRKKVLSRVQPSRWQEYDVVHQGFTLDYLIRFQNTTSDTVQNVLIKDVLHPCLDLTTFQPTLSSHNHFLQLIDGELSFRFENINLPPNQTDELGSQGFVRYSVQMRPSCALGTNIENTATIQFDQTFPDITNTTINTVTHFTGLTEVASVGFNLFPNPANHEVFIIPMHEMTLVERIHLFDFQGKLLITQSGNRGMNRIDISTLNAGIYLLRIQTEKGIQVERVVKN